MAARIDQGWDALAPYLDRTKLDRAVAAVGQPGDDETAQTVFEALALGQWLTRRTART